MTVQAPQQNPAYVIRKYFKRVLGYCAHLTQTFATNMQSAVLVLVLLLANFSMAAASAAPCQTNITISETSITTIFKPITTVYDYGNISHTRSTDVLKVFENVTSIPVTSVAVSTHTSFDSTSSTAKNATSTICEEVNSASDRKTTTSANFASTTARPTTESPYLSATNVSEIYATKHRSPATSKTSTTVSSYTLRSSDGPPLTSASSKVVNMAALPNQSNIISTTIQIKETTVTKLARITCTIGSSCLDKGISMSYTSSEASTFEVTSSTMTRTIIVQTSAASSNSWAAVTPLSPRPITASVKLSTNATKDVAQSNISALTTKSRLLNSTSVANVPAVSTSSNNTVLSTSSSLSSNSSSGLSTSVVVTTVPNSQPLQTESAPQTSTSTVVVTPIIVPITSTVTASSSDPALNTNAAGNLQPPRAFGLLAALAGLLGRGKAKSVTTTPDSTILYPPPAPRSEVISTTTITPTKYITVPPPQCTEQICMPNLGFNSAASRLLPGPPFMVSLFSNFFKVRADSTTRPTTATTITVTIYRYENNETVTSTENVTSTSVDTILLSSCAPYCGLPGGIDAPSTTDTSTLFSRPGSAPKPSMGGRPTGGTADKEEKLGLVLLFLLMVLVL